MLQKLEEGCHLLFCMFFMVHEENAERIFFGSTIKRLQDKTI